MKKLLLLLVIPFLSLGQEQWFQTFGGLGNDRGNVVQQTNESPLQASKEDVDPTTIYPPSFVC